MILGYILEGLLKTSVYFYSWKFCNLHLLTSTNPHYNHETEQELYQQKSSSREKGRPVRTKVAGVVGKCGGY